MNTMLNTMRYQLLPLLTFSSVLFLGACVQLPVSALSAKVVTLVGNAMPGSTDGQCREARLNRPHGISLLPDGSLLVADRGNHTIRIVDPEDATRTLAGGGKAGFAEGRGIEALFNEPIAVVADRKGNIFVADRNNHRIRRMAADGTVTTVAGNGNAGYADGASRQAKFNQPYGVALDDAEITLYVADYLNHAIRIISLLSGEVSTLAGNGTAGFTDGAGTTASFNQPYNLKNDGHGALIVPDQNNHAVRRVGMNGMVTTLAGSGSAGYADGKGQDTKFDNPTGAVADANGTVFVADRNNHRVRRLGTDGMVTTLAGTGEAGLADGSAAQAQFNRPLDVAVSPDGKILVSEENNHSIRAITP